MINYARVTKMWLIIIRAPYQKRGGSMPCAYYRPGTKLGASDLARSCLKKMLSLFGFGVFCAPSLKNKLIKFF